MKMTHIIIAGMLSAATLGAMQTASAVETSPAALLYISPIEYKNSVHLLSPYYEYWFEQGPIVEPIALQALKTRDATLAMCTANETADTIIRLKPRIFYNPQMKVYHSKLEATVYNGGGELIGNYAGEAQQQGFTSFDNGTNYHIKKVYDLAMKDLMRKIELKASSQTDNKTAGMAKLPCGLIGAQAEPVFNFY